LHLFIISAASSLYLIAHPTRNRFPHAFPMQ
jgi:hypothetical protein